jgi:hypothetical protein
MTRAQRTPACIDSGNEPAMTVAGMRRSDMSFRKVWSPADEKASGLSRG